MSSSRARLKRVLRRLGVRRRPPVYRPGAIGRPVVELPPVRIAAFGWARTNQLFDFLERGVYTAWEFDAANYDVPLEVVRAHQWGLKGYGYSLVADAVARLAAPRPRPLRVLDVGAGGSGLPRALAEKFGAESWVIDDFGIESQDTPTASWYRPGLRDALVERNPSVHYVFGRLGGPRLPELKPGYFDLICSVSTLEHIPLGDMAAVFDHMFELLDESSGAMVHGIDLRPGQLVEWQNFLGRYFRRRGVDPATFVTPGLNEAAWDDPPLLESAEVIYSMYGQPRRARQMSTLLLDARYGEAPRSNSS